MLSCFTREIMDVGTSDYIRRTVLRIESHDDLEVMGVSARHFEIMAQIIDFFDEEYVLMHDAHVVSFLHLRVFPQFSGHYRHRT